MWRVSLDLPDHFETNLLPVPTFLLQVRGTRMDIVLLLFVIGINKLAPILVLVLWRSSPFFEEFDFTLDISFSSCFCVSHAVRTLVLFVSHLGLTCFVTAFAFLVL